MLAKAVIQSLELLSTNASNFSLQVTPNFSPSLLPCFPASVSAAEYRLKHLDKGAVRDGIVGIQLKPVGRYHPDL